jgi:hypothetical protein
MAKLTETQIAEYERRLRDAMLMSDIDELDELLAQDLTFTDHFGALWRKADDLAAHRAGVIRVESVVASDERIQLLDQAAIVSVRLDIAGRFAGVAANGAFRFTRVWAPTLGGKWQVVAAHSTLIAGDQADSGD